LRHLKSQWNLENRFSGWVDNPLSKEGSEQQKEVADKLVNINFDVIYTSPLIRNQQTVIKILKNLGNKYPIFEHFGGKMEKWGNFEGDGSHIPVFVSETLNERYYGKLQGLDKEETAEKYGENQVHLWRRSYDIAPPGGESLKDVCKRTLPFYKKYIEKVRSAEKEGREIRVTIDDIKRAVNISFDIFKSTHGRLFRADDGSSII
jgi:2,3-bisphosphoglycerate-dependent phosphoglycerate mutase